MGTNPSEFNGTNLPVENVSWHDAVEYCRKLSQKEGKTYRLPTEAEWEYACRAGSTTVYSFGDDASQLDKYAWHKKNSNRTTHPVGMKQPNGFGLYDMHGNVAEWCADWYDGDYQAKSAVEDPKGPEVGSKRVLRGGVWSGPAEVCRSTFRVGDVPTLRISILGFRVVRDR